LEITSSLPLPSRCTFARAKKVSCFLLGKSYHERAQNDFNAIFD